MHTVAQTKAFEKSADDAGMSEEEIEDLISYLAENPMAGDEMEGTGGCRKIRVAGRGKGKSGGYRTVTFYSGENLPVFLITVFGKGEKSNLTPKEKAAIRTLTKAIVTEYKQKVASLAAGRKGVAG
jgi:hypothetical protein